VLANKTNNINYGRRNGKINKALLLPTFGISNVPRPYILLLAQYLVGESACLHPNILSLYNLRVDVTQRSVVIMRYLFNFRFKFFLIKIMLVS